MLTNGLRVLVLTDEEGHQIISQCILTALPTTTVVALGPAALAARQLSPAECAVVDQSYGGAPGIEALRGLRAAGYEGPALLLVEGIEPAIAARANALGAARTVARDRMASELAPAIVEVTGRAESSSAMQELRRMQRLVAAGEIAVGLQHAINNPLAALLAEAQLLEMEPLADEHLRAARRIVELCRRVVTIVRQLDGVGRRGLPTAARHEDRRN